MRSPLLRLAASLLLLAGCGKRKDGPTTYDTRSAIEKLSPATTVFAAAATADAFECIS